MQVLQWLLKVSQDQKPAKYDGHKYNKPSNKIKEEEENSNELVCHNQIKKVSRKARKPEESGLDCRNFSYLAALLLRSRGESRTYYCSTINQKTLKSLNHREHKYFLHSMKMIKEDHQVGNNNKVLPIGDSNPSISSSVDEDHDQKHCGPSMDQKKGRVKGDQNDRKINNSSRMKELMRWAAASKSEKGGKFGRKGLQFRSRTTTTKSGRFDEELVDDSKSNISQIRWEVQRHSTTGSVPYGHQRTPTSLGQWITTDDEFVVLEL